MRKKSHKPTFYRERSTLSREKKGLCLCPQSSLPCVNICSLCYSSFTWTMTAQVCQAACRCSLTSTHSHASACTHKHKTLLRSAYVEMTQHLLAFHCHWCPCCLPWALPLAQSHITDINKESGREKKKKHYRKEMLEMHASTVTGDDFAYCRKERHHA